MTISTTSSQATFLGNGATNVFTFSYVVDDPTTFEALFNDGTTITLLNPTQYTLFLNPPVGDSLHHVGGTVTYPKAGPAMANGEQLITRRIVPLTQDTSISNQGDFAPIVVELALDEQCLETQQVSARTGQIRGTWQTGIAYNFGDIVQDGVNGANTLNYYMCAIANTSGVWATDLAAGDWSLGINVQQIQGFAISAAASAATATTEAGIATTEAGVATAQAATATTQAGIATAQAGVATAEAAAALVSENNAASSAASAAADVVLTHADVVLTHADVVLTHADVVTTNADAAAAAASAVLAGSALTATSTTSNTIGISSLTFTTQASKNFFPGQFMIAASNANDANYVHGQVTSYSGTTLVINVTDIGGSGTHNDWNISVSGPGPNVSLIDGGSA